MIRLYAIGALVLALAILGGFAWHERNVAVAAREAARIASSQAELNEQTTKTIEKFHETTHIIEKQAEARADAVQQIPSSDIPDDVRGAWLGSLRQEGRPPATDDPR